jgi:hypothetical protein
MKTWWWTSILYTLLMIVIQKAFHPSPGLWAHLLTPLAILSWILLPSSIIWTIVSLSMFFSRSRRWSGSDKVKLAMGILVCALTGVEVVASWPNVL